MIVIGAILGVPVFIVMMRIALMGTRLGSPVALAGENTANAAIIQMAQWTITTVLALGGALIGLNWYQGEKRFDRDRANLEEALSTAQVTLTSLQQRYSQLEEITGSTLQEVAKQQLLQECGNVWHDATLHVTAVLREEALGSLRGRAAAELSVQFAESPGISFSMTTYGWMALSEVMPFLMQHYPEHGGRLGAIFHRHFTSTSQGPNK